MHYAGKDGSRNSEPAIQALNPLYQYTMGQRMAISYYDAKIINRAYCQGGLLKNIPSAFEGIVLTLPRLIYKNLFAERPEPQISDSL